MPFRAGILYIVYCIKRNTEYSIQNTKYRKSRGSPSKALLCRAKEGFSLIEILIALFVIVALVTILFSSSGTLFTTRSSKLQTVATKIASKEIENLRNIAFASLPAAGTDKACSTIDPDLSKLKGPPTCKEDVANYDGKSDALTDIKQVTVKINWKTDNGADQNLKMDTLIYRNGL